MSTGSGTPSPTAMPNLQVTFNYVLILEWLDSRDEPTGQQLHEHLNALGIPSKLRICSKPDDIRDAIANATRQVGTEGVPVIHLETHASDPFEGDVRDVEFGACAAPGLRWLDLGGWLAPLNSASKFRLMVVGAACYGFGAIAAMKVYGHVAPFAGCVGFTTSVGPGSVREAMIELYRTIARGEGLNQSVTNASSELRRADETLRMTSAPKLAYQVLRGVYDSIRTPFAMSTRVTKIMSQVEGFGIAVEQSVVAALPAVLRERSRVRMRQAWDAWFPKWLQESDPAYCLDWSLVEEWWPRNAESA